MNRRLHNFSIHAFGLLVMFASAGVVFLFAESLRDLYRVSGDYGRSVITGLIVGVVGAFSVFLSIGLKSRD